MDSYLSFDGVRIAFQAEGAGFPVLLLHGFLATGANNYVSPGIARALHGAQFRTIIPDLRGHGASDMPEDLGAYPVDVLAMDQEALLRRLGVEDYALVGYSLGARTAVRMLARGARPRRCVLAGMGAEGITDAKGRSAEFETLVRLGAQAGNREMGALVAGMMKRNHLRPQAVLNILAQQASTTRAQLAAITTPILVVAGRNDHDNGSPEELARLLPNAQLQFVPGTHLSAVRAPELGRAIVDFLSSQEGELKKATTL